MTWTRIYSHDGDGTPISGDKDALIAAVENGAAVRVIYHGVENEEAYKLVMDVNPAASASGHVLGQAGWTNFDFSPEWDYLTYPNGDTPYILNLSTSGKVNRLRRDSSGGVQTDIFHAELEWACDV